MVARSLDFILFGARHLFRGKRSLFTWNTSCISSPLLRGSERSLSKVRERAQKERTQRLLFATSKRSLACETVGGGSLNLSLLLNPLFLSLTWLHPWRSSRGLLLSAPLIRDARGFGGEADGRRPKRVRREAFQFRGSEYRDSFLPRSLRTEREREEAANAEVYWSEKKKKKKLKDAWLSHAAHLLPRNPRPREPSGGIFSALLLDFVSSQTTRAPRPPLRRAAATRERRRAADSFRL